jgi:hypothetical protein
MALGEGLFDQLMATVKHHISQEYDAQRIKGDNYSKLYLGSLEAVLGNSTQYLLGTMLIDEKKEQLKLQNELIELQKEELRFKIDYLYPLEVTKTEAEIALINAQIGKIDKEKEFLTAKINTEKANVTADIAEANSLIGKQKTLLAAQVKGFAVDGYQKSGKLQSDFLGIYQSVMEPEGSMDATDYENMADILGKIETTAGDIEGL